LFTGCKHETPPLSEEEYSQTKKHLVEVNKILVRKDRLTIMGYIERNHLDMQESKTGLWYKIIKKGEGNLAETGKIATIDFRIGLLDGTECYNSKTQGRKSFRIGRGGVESGLEEGILMLNAGGKAKFIMPPHLAYGLPGDGNKIPARAIIIYDVDVVSIE
jgi:FKBP-type peptidyl-prolyl cis-trans isomerase